MYSDKLEINIEAESNKVSIPINYVNAKMQFQPICWDNKFSNKILSYHTINWFSNSNYNISGNNNETVNQSLKFSTNDGYYYW